jgi:hypothetical protein
MRGAVGLTSCFMLAALTGSATGQSQALEHIQRESLSSLLGTISVVALPQFKDGQLYGCVVEYNVLSRDWIYVRGEFIRVGGSFGVLTSQRNVGGMLKVILFDLDPRTMTFTPSPRPPTLAYLVASDFSTNKASVLTTFPTELSVGYSLLSNCNRRSKLLTTVC